MEMYSLDKDLKIKKKGNKKCQARTFAMIKPDAYKHIGKIISAIEREGFVISNIRMTRMRPEDAQQFYAEHQVSNFTKFKGKSFYEGLISFMTSGRVLGLELIADDAIKRWRRLIGPTNCFKAREEAPNSLRALYGTDGTQNACHGSDSGKYIINR